MVVNPWKSSVFLNGATAHLTWIGVEAIPPPANSMLVSWYDVFLEKSGNGPESRWRRVCFSKWANCGVRSMVVAAFVALGNIQAPASSWWSDRAAGASEAAGAPLRGNLASTSVTPAPEKPLTSNPLWTIPLSALSETVARPLFSPSRRPSAPLISAVPVIGPTRSPPEEPDYPGLTLLGTIVGKSKGIAVVLDQMSKSVLRLRTGQVHAGWTLRLVSQRVASFEKDRHVATLALPAAGANQAAGVALESLGRGRTGICANSQIVGPLPESCVRSGPPRPDRAPTQPSANSRKKRWHDAVEAVAARRAR